MSEQTLAMSDMSETRLPVRKTDDESFVVELPIRLYDYQDLIIPLLEAVAKREAASGSRGTDDPVALLASEIVSLLRKTGTDTKNHSPHGLVVFVIHLVKQGRPDAALRAIEAAEADIDLSRRLRAFFASLPNGERPAPIERWPERLRELLTSPKYSTLGPNTAQRIASANYAGEFLSALEQRIQRKVESKQLPRAVLTLLTSLLVLFFAGAAAAGGLSGSGARVPASETSSAAPPSGSSRRWLSRGSKLAAVATVFVAATALMRYQDGGHDRDVATTTRRVQEVDASATTLGVAPQSPSPSEPACQGSPQEQKRCYLALARRHRATDPDGARDAYERSLAFQYEPREADREDTLTALLELASLEVKYSHIPEALVAYRRYLDGRPRPITNGDCGMLYALALRVEAGEAALAEVSACQESGIRPDEPPFWGNTKTAAPTCHAEERIGQTLEQLGRYNEAFWEYAGALEDLLNKGEQGLADERAELTRGDWGNLHCESPSRPTLVARARAVGDKLQASGDLVWFGNEAIARNPQMPEGFSFRLVALSPSDYGCRDEEAPIWWRSYTIAANAVQPPPGDSGLMYFSDRLVVGLNELTIQTRFGLEGQERPTGCADAVRTYRFCRTASNGISADSSCHP